MTLTRNTEAELLMAAAIVTLELTVEETAAAERVAVTLAELLEMREVLPECVAEALACRHVPEDRVTGAGLPTWDDIVMFSQEWHRRRIGWHLHRYPDVDRGSLRTLIEMKWRAAA